MVDTSARLYSVLKVPVLGSMDLRAVFFEVINTSCDHLGRDLAVPATPALGL
jgi:hypothetical protein